MNDEIRSLDGANMDIDLVTPEYEISWEQDRCSWNEVEGATEHRCAIKNVSICRYFCGVKFQDCVLCCYPHENPYRKV
jgi:hypothetical protein